MRFDNDEVYRLFRQSHKELYEDLWQLIERRESRLSWRWLGDHSAEGVAEYAFEDVSKVTITASGPNPNGGIHR